MATLINEELSISLTEAGAELTSIFDINSKTEYLWSGDGKIWGRQSPILFPIVGRLINNNYMVGDKAYTLPQHGFARDLVFDKTNQKNDKIVFSLVSSATTLLNYPYQFELQISYTLTGRKLTVEYSVLNKDNKNIYFSIGAHPGFNCPVNAGEKFEDYYLEFSEPETLNLHILSEGLISDQTTPFLKNETKIPLSYELFKEDALVFKGYKSDFISLKHKEKGEVFKFHFGGYPFLGIWSKPGPFVCIEPWYGIADFTSHLGEFTNKTGIQNLGVGKTFSCEWSVEFSTSFLN